MLENYAVLTICIELRVKIMDIYGNLLLSIQQDYETVRVIKESDRGTVSDVRHKKNGIRYLFRHYCGSGEAYRRLLGVSCEYLPLILEVGERDGKTAVLEEFVQGDTLGEILEGGTLRPAQAKKLMLPLCRGLWVLHEKGVIHRDIKPDNVIVKGDSAVLIDFDASRICRDSRSKDTTVLGTVGYAAPEQYGLSQTNEQSDIYAMGVLLNMMLTGKYPSQKLAGGKMGRIVQHCTMASPQKRYKNVIQLMEAL